LKFIDFAKNAVHEAGKVNILSYHGWNSKIINIVHHVGTIYGHDISNELQNKKTVIIAEPKHTQDVLDKHAAKEVRRQTQQTRLDQARLLQKTQLEAEVDAGTNMDASMLLAILDNEIDEAIYQATLALPIKLDDMEQTHHYNE
jgi:hypothetical protein